MTVNVDIEVSKYESVEKALRRFSKRCKKEKIISECVERMYHQTKTQKRRKRRNKRQLRRQKNESR